MEFLHSKGLMHGDIKSLNFLVTENLHVKLSDLGEARRNEDLNIASSEARALPRFIVYPPSFIVPFLKEITTTC